MKMKLLNIISVKMITIFWKVQLYFLCYDLLLCITPNFWTHSAGVLNSLCVYMCFLFEILHVCLLHLQCGKSTFFCYLGFPQVFYLLCGQLFLVVFLLLFLPVFLCVQVFLLFFVRGNLCFSVFLPIFWRRIVWVCWFFPWRYVFSDKYTTGVNIPW